MAMRKDSFFLHEIGKKKKIFLGRVAFYSSPFSVFIAVRNVDFFRNVIEKKSKSHSPEYTRANSNNNKRKMRGGEDARLLPFPPDISLTLTPSVLIGVQQHGCILIHKRRNKERIILIEFVHHTKTFILYLRVWMCAFWETSWVRIRLIKRHWRRNTYKFIFSSYRRKPTHLDSTCTTFFVLHGQTSHETREQ